MNALLYGIGIAIISFVYTMVLYLMGFHSEEMIGNVTMSIVGLVVSLAMFVGGIFLAIRATSVEKQEEGEPYGYWRAFGTGVLTSLYATILSAILLLAYIYFINPAFIDVVFDAEVLKAEAKGAPPEQIEQMVENAHVVKPIMIASMSIFVSFFNMFIGALLSLICPLFSRKNEEAVA